MGFWEEYNKLTIGIWLAVFVAAIFLYPIGTLIHDTYFKKEYLYQCKVLKTAPNGSILIVLNEDLIQKIDSLSYLKLGHSDTTHINSGELLIIGGFAEDSTYAKVYFRGGWKGNTEITGFTRLENLECWRLIQP
jgi:hypothetical protein